MEFVWKKGGGEPRVRDGPSEMKDWPVRDECVGGGAGPGCSLRRQALFVCFQGAGRLRRWARYARAVAGVAGGRGGTCIGREEVAKGEAGVARRRCCVGWRKSGAHLIVPLRIREEDAGRAQRRAGRAQRVVMVRLERVKRAQHMWMCPIRQPQWAQRHAQDARNNSPCMRRISSNQGSWWTDGRAEWVHVGERA